MPRFYALPAWHTLRFVSERLNFSFSDAAAGLHCYGAGDLALVLGPGATSAPPGSIEGDLATGRFAIDIAGVCVCQLEALGPPVVYAIGERRDWLCRVRGTSAGGGKLTGLGCVTAGPPELGNLALRRSIWICFGDELGFTLTAERGSGKHDHGDEDVLAFAARGTPLTPTRVADPRLSSTYGADRQLLRAGLELWPEDDDDEAPRERSHALRIAGETIATGQLGNTSVAFLTWRHDGRHGIGCYTIET
jgi:hypothetical protein